MDMKWFGCPGGDLEAGDAEGGAQWGSFPPLGTGCLEKAHSKTRQHRTPCWKQSPTSWDTWFWLFGTLYFSRTTLLLLCVCLISEGLQALPEHDSLPGGRPTWKAQAQADWSWGLEEAPLLGPGLDSWKSCFARHMVLTETLSHQSPGVTASTQRTFPHYLRNFSKNLCLRNSPAQWSW